MPEVIDQPGKVGRPTVYAGDETCIAAHQMAEGGATDFEIAQALGISSATFYRWAGQHPEFREAVKLGKEASDTRVERSLYHRANGYSYEAIKIMQHDGQPLIVPYVEHVPPDPGAAMNWLKNRKPDEWRDRQEITGAGGKDLIPESDSEIARRLLFMLTAGVKQENADG